MGTTDRLDIIYSLTSILAIKESMSISILELEKSTNPKAIEYIKGMKNHITKMGEVYLTVRSLEDEIRILNRMNFNYHKENMDLRNQINDLKKQVERLTNNL